MVQVMRSPLLRLLRGTFTAAAAPAEVESPFAATDQLSRITWSSLFPDLDLDSLPVTRDQALSVPAVGATRMRIVGTLSRLRIRAVTATGAAWAGPTGLLDQPDPAEPHHVTLQKTLDDILFDGRSWWAVTAAYNDQNPDGTRRARPNNVQHVPLGAVSLDGDGWPSVTDSHLAWLDRTGRPRPLTAPDGRPWLICFAGPHPGLCTAAGGTVRSAISLGRSADNAARNPVPSIELHQTTAADMTDDDIQAMIRTWEDARRAGGVGYTNQAIELKTHGQQPEQLLIDGRNQQAVEIARHAGIPAASIDAAVPGTSITYANLIDRVTDLVNMGLQPYAVAIAGRLSMDDCLPHGVTARFDYAELFPAAQSAAPKTPALPAREGAPA